MVNNGTSSGRGSYKKAMESDYIVYDTRKLIGELFNFKDTKKIIFTSNITESINIVLRGMLKDNDHVITSSIEHNAVWRTLKTLEKERNIQISKAKCNKYGFTDVNDVKKLIKENTALFVFNSASNVIGTIQPIREIGKIAKNIEPLKTGGTGGDSSYEYQVDYYPNKLETGTLNVSGIAGLREGIKFIKKEGIEKINNKEKELTKYTLDRLEEVRDIEIYGPKDCEKITSVISFNIKNKKAEEIAYDLDKKYGIMVRAGLHCSPLVHEVIGTKECGTVRVSIGYFNTKEDIDKLVYALNNL